MEYTFYTDGGSDGEYSFRASGYHDAGELDLDHMPSSITLEKSEIVSKRTVNVNGIEWSGTYTGSDQTGFKNSEKKKLQKFGVIDSYKTSSYADYERIEVYHETGKVKEYYCYESNDTLLPKTEFSESEIVKKAEDAISEMFGFDVLEQCVLRGCSYNDQTERYVAVYDLKMYGYTTTAGFYVSFNNKGELRKLSADDYYEFKAVENDVTKEMILNAETALRAKIPEKLTVQEDATEIMLDGNTGKLYLRMYARQIPTFDENGNKVLGDKGFFYVNIE